MAHGRCSPANFRLSRLPFSEVFTRIQQAAPVAGEYPQRMSESQFSYRWLNDQGPAFGSPGLEPRWTSSKKDSVITAYSAASRVWVTLSHGTLNEIYYPTVDRPQTRDMELLFTDGETFFHEEKRDLQYDFHYLDPDGLAVQVRATADGGLYTVTKQIITDPHHPTVLVNVRIESADAALLARMRCYVLLAPHLDVGGAGNNGRSIDVAGKRTLVAWKGNVALALGVSCGFSRSSCGYVGKSDGYQDLFQDKKMDWQFGEALDGNIALTGEVELGKAGEFTIAIGFGANVHAAFTCMTQTLADPFQQHCDRFIDQWKRVGARAGLGSASMDKGRLSRISENVVLAHEDKRFSGAFNRLRVHPVGRLQGRRRPRRLPPRLDARHGAVRHRAHRLRSLRHGAPRARLSRLHAACRRRLPAKFLDRRPALLVRHPAG